MAGAQSGEPLESTGGAIDGPAAVTGDDQTPAASDQTGADAEQTLSDVDQTSSDRDQTDSDRDQTNADRDQNAADRDQNAADRDQAASDRDQAASDRDQAHGADPQTHEYSREIRRRTARDRDDSAAMRLKTAGERDNDAQGRDLLADLRDRTAAARDLAIAQRDAALELDADPRAITGAEVVMRAAAYRKRAADQRAQAAEHRLRASQDREAAARDREHAARDRQQALADREALAHQLAIAETDALTGARTRAAGLTDLDHELDRCRRSGGSLVVAYVDVVGLKAVNDSAGHMAGDELLKRVVDGLRAHLRSYDLVIRIGGDEFLCAMSNMALSDARERLRHMAAALAASPEAGAVRAGFAELLTDDRSVEDLIARADHELIGTSSRN